MWGWSQCVFWPLTTRCASTRGLYLYVTIKVNQWQWQFLKCCIVEAANTSHTMYNLIRVKSFSTVAHEALLDKPLHNIQSFKGINCGTIQSHTEKWMFKEFSLHGDYRLLDIRSPSITCTTSEVKIKVYWSISKTVPLNVTVQLVSMDSDLRTDQRWPTCTGDI